MFVGFASLGYKEFYMLSILAFNGLVLFFYFLILLCMTFHPYPAEDCSSDKENYIVPIAVGVALAVLVIIVLVAYLIGRSRNRSAGYEQF